MKNLILIIMNCINEMVKRAFTWLNAIQKSKYQHYVLGAAIAAAIFFASPPFLVLITTSWVLWLALGLSIFTVVACAVWKEYIHDEEADKKNVYVTIAGGATVWIVALLAYIL
jgi:hypothetical protein